MTPPRAGANLDIVLASSSPRRRAFLRALGWPYRAVAPDIDETPRSGETPATHARRAAIEKALAVARQLPPAARPRVVIGCDTVVAIGDRWLGKPRDAAEAVRMLRQLSGRAHRVISGLALVFQRPGRRDRRWSRVVQSTVVFRRLSPAEIDAYVASGEPMDKAGAYGIQEGAALFVRSVRGSYTNIVGLPIAELLDELAAIERALPATAMQRRAAETRRSRPSTEGAAAGPLDRSRRRPRSKPPAAGQGR